MEHFDHSTPYFNDAIMAGFGLRAPSSLLWGEGIKWLVSKETLCCVGGQVKQLVDYQLEVDKGKLTAVANLKS